MYCRLCGHVGAEGEPYECDYETPDDESWAICPTCGGTNAGGFGSYTDMDIIQVDDRPCPPMVNPRGSIRGG